MSDTGFIRDDDELPAPPNVSCYGDSDKRASWIEARNRFYVEIADIYDVRYNHDPQVGEALSRAVYDLDERAFYLDDPGPLIRALDRLRPLANQLRDLIRQIENVPAHVPRPNRDED